MAWDGEQRASFLQNRLLVIEFCAKSWELCCTFWSSRVFFLGRGSLLIVVLGVANFGQVVLWVGIWFCCPLLGWLCIGKARACLLCLVGWGLMPWFFLYRGKEMSFRLGNKVSSKEQLVAVIRKNVKARIQFKGPSLILEICTFAMDGKLHHN